MMLGLKFQWEAQGLIGGDEVTGLTVHIFNFEVALQQVYLFFIFNIFILKQKILKSTKV